MDSNKGIIAWFARNSVAANLLMICILVGGLLSAMTINKKVFPSIELNTVSVTVSYPGAAPQEIEEGINIKIEEAIKEIEGIKQVISTANEGYARVIIEVETEYDAAQVLDEVKLQVDAIATFPDNIEKPQIYRIKPQEQVLWVSIYGDIDKFQMKEMAKEIRDEITNLPGVTRAEVQGAADYEIAIEVTEHQLQEYGLTFAQVASAVQRSSIDLPGGAIKAHNGNILLRTKGQAYTGDDFASIIVKTQADGSRVRLRDIATISDGFAEGLTYTRFNRQPAVLVQVSSVGDQNALKISEQVNAYVTERRSQLPKGIHLDTWGDFSYYLQGRLDLMLSNMLSGALLVFLILALFMRFRLAFWVMMGLPVCFLGTLLVMPLGMVNLSINMITLFAFIMVLGIVVDDAIVIGESSYSEIERRGHSIDSVIIGAQRVAMPATFGVLTTIAAFMPMVMVSGQMSVFTKSIGLVVILCLLFSLVESKLILPAHLARMKHSKAKDNPGLGGRIRQGVDRGLKHFIQNIYRPFLEWALDRRYAVLASFIALLILCSSLLSGGLVRWVFFPNIPSDFIQLELTMNESTAEVETQRAAQRIEEALYRANEKLHSEYGDDVIKHSFIAMNSATDIFILAELKKGENREVDGVAISEAWRDEIPEIAGVKKMEMEATTGAGGGSPIAFQLTGKDLATMRLATAELKAKLREYDGVYDVADSSSSGRQEIRLHIKPAAEALGLSLADLAQQVRWSFYGYEAQRILRGTEEIKVMVRYPLEKRQTIGHLESMRVRTAQGTEVPFSSVADIEIGEGYSSIIRVDGRRAITVTANANKDKVEPGKIVQEVKEEFLPDLLARYPGIEAELDGEAKNESEAIWDLAKGAFFALFTIYALMAIPLRSYSQPLIIMSVIPFGVIGAIFGHFVMGLSLSLLSMFGIIALIGVVVNDSLVMVDFVNNARKAGHSIREATVEAGCNRFRAIVLTSLTTFFGLIPIMTETSLQAKILIPMAASIAFGILFSTVITLLLVPSLYMIGGDISRGLSHVRRFFSWSSDDSPVTHP